MHNRKKTGQPPTELEIDTRKKKLKGYVSLSAAIFDKRKNFEFTDVALQLTSEMIKANPDYYTIWNYRKEILLGFHKDLFNVDPAEKISAEVGGTLRDSELSLTAQAITKNPKSYSAWYHRTWILERFQCDLNQELDLCRALLKIDQRNFHCWNYRRQVITIINSQTSASAEFQFSLEKIEENISNYSAFHHRSVYIKQLGRTPMELLDVELSLVENAIFTEPDDQSAWWYHQFLIKWAASESILNKSNEWFLAILKRQLEVIDTLLEVEPSSKWAMVEVVNLIDTITTSITKETLPDGFLSVLNSKRVYFLEQLIIIDPMHKCRYEYLLAAK